MPITDVAARNAKPTDKAYKLSDAGGLFMLVTPSGGKLWRMKYRFGGKEKSLAFGQYPSTSLAEARKRRDDAKRALAEGVDPSGAKKEAKRRFDLSDQRTFEKVAREWFQKKEGAVVGTYSSRIWTRVETDLIPDLGRLAIESIEPPEVLAAIHKIEDRGALEMGKLASLS